MTNQISVCFVEDEPLMRNYLFENISKIHPDFYIKDLASNYNEAINLLSNNEYGLLITDIKIPGGSGLELIEKLREFGNDISTIIVTGYDDFEYAKTAIKLNVLGYLLKPLNDDEMKEILEKIKIQIAENRNIIKLSKNITSDEITRLIANKFSSEQTSDSTIGQKAVEYISQHFKENISQSDVAEAIGVTPSYLSNIFREENGESYSKFITSLRMAQAALLLKTKPNLSLKSIAEEIGYFSEKHFISLFKNFYGLTPNDYRKSK
mgnify:CR=1 FL=1